MSEMFNRENSATEKLSLPYYASIINEPAEGWRTAGFGQSYGERVGLDER